GGKTMSGTGGGFHVSSTGILTTTGGNILTTGGVLTLNSDASGSASVAQIISGSITGNVNVKRYVAGSISAYRSYRYFSSPVNQTANAVGGHPGYGFTDLQQQTPITGWGTGAAFTPTPSPGQFDTSPLGNPSLFFYYEPDLDPANSSIAISDYKGLSSINDAFPVGNGFLFYYRGDRNGGPNTFVSGSTPTTATLQYTGLLNQGNIQVYIPTLISTVTPYNGTSKVYDKSILTAANVIQNFSYTSHGSNNDGFHLMGNPYACTIDLEKLTITTPPLGNNYIYMLNNAGIMGAYLLTSNSLVLNNGVGRFVLAGQGFFVKGNSLGTTQLQFTEACKVTSGITTPTVFALNQSPAKPIQSLQVRLTLDSVNYNETVINFGYNNAKNKFLPLEDAYYNYGLSQTTFMASYSSDNQPLLINQMGSLDSIKTIPLYAEGQINGTYTMKFTGVSTIDPRFKLWLKDNLLKDSLDLSANSVYTFNIDRGNTQTYGATRFSLVVQPTHIADRYNLLIFNGVKGNSSVLLNWTTQNEGDYTGFTVQRSTDGGKTYAVIDTLQSNGAGAYNYTDSNPATNGTNLYRLVQNNINNVNSFSNIVTISYQPISSIAVRFEVFPNPAVNSIQVKLKDQSPASTLYIKVYNMSGNLVLDTKVSTGNSLTQDINNLIKGSYVINITDSNSTNYGAATFTKL
ncbi:MAG: hypothetical protein JWQ79_1275, partial [Mucilaginibacter sp.]|nr:hypothetical protein [Mucilaginibacter sp.]